jgi:hypothetical protein
MENLIIINNELYQVKRTFKSDGGFNKVVESVSVEEILSNYHCDKLLRGSNGIYYLVNEIKDAEIIETPIENEIRTIEEPDNQTI